MMIQRRKLSKRLWLRKKPRLNTGTPFRLRQGTLLTKVADWCVVCLAEELSSLAEFKTEAEAGLVAQKQAYEKEIVRTPNFAVCKYNG